MEEMSLLLPTGELRPDLEVTQIGGRRRFRTAPRSQLGERTLSVIGGRLRPEDSVALAFGRLPTAQDCVRYASVVVLREAGFVVEWNPTRRNRLHCSIESPTGWDEDVRERFNACFGEIVEMER
ncbi:MAG TPA: hypothetical protein VF486_16055 [Actinomycetes bacterium]